MLRIKPVNNILFLFIIKPPSVKKCRVRSPNAPSKGVIGDHALQNAFALCEPSLSSLIMLDMAKTLSLAKVREAQVEVSDVRVLLQFL